jgi:iron complex outermembrane receptor protein
MTCGSHSVLLASASAVAFVSLAHGQTAPDAGQTTMAVAQTTSVAGPPTAKSDQESGSAAILQEVTVTGSRTIRNALDSPTPLTEVSVADMAEVHPGTVADDLNDLPIFSGSRGQAANASNGSLSGGPAAPNPSANVLNLRNMGFTRTLILFDGKRVPPTSPDGTVDVNMIPQILLHRVDVVTGGASAIYGSDAVTGVVNFVVDKHFNGLMVNAYSGISHDRDDKINDQGIAWGTDLFDGRGHFEASFQNHDDPNVLLRSQRAWGRDVWTVQGGGIAANPYHLVNNTRIAGSTFGGLISSGALNGQMFDANGFLTPFGAGVNVGAPKNAYQSGGDGAYYNSSFKAALHMDQLFARADYDFSDSVHGDATVTASYNQNANVAQDNILSNATMSAQNAFLQPAYQAALAAQTFQFNKTWLDVPAQGTHTWERQYFAVLGLEGKFGSDYTWNASYSHSETRQNTRQNANINNERLSAALDAVVNPANGQAVCNVSLTNPGLYPGCVPLDVFGLNSESQAAVNYIVAATDFRSTLTQDDVSASVTGTPIRDWAGPINVALSAEWRRLGYELVSDAQPSDPVSCTGLRFNCSASTQFWAVGATADRSPVSEKVSEGALELDVPLLADTFLAKSVSFNGAARYTYYDTSGSAVTWKAGLVWKLNDQLTLRAARSRDIRAPTLNDLYLPTSLSTIQVTDLLTGQTQVVPQQAGGNPHLVPEVGYTSTAGFVYSPEWLPRFNLTLDGFWINITNAITSIQGTNPTVQKICYASGGSSPYCALQQRPNGFADISAANGVTKWYSEEINIASQRTAGADLDANYTAEPFGHPLSLRVLTTYQPHIIYTTPGLTTIDLGGVAFSSNALQASPVWRTTFTGTYNPLQNFAVTVMERLRSSLAFTGDSTQAVSSPRIPSVAYTDLNLSYQIKRSDSQTELFFNVQNLFNKQPPPAAFLGANGAVGSFGGFAYGDDPVGAYFTVGLRYRR